MHRLSSSAIIISLLIMVSGITDRISARALLDQPASPIGATLLKPTAFDPPNNAWEVHHIGRIGLTVTNYGTIGTGYAGSALLDGERAPSCEYPLYSDLNYLFAGCFWIGAIVGRDTLVSIGADGWSGTTELFPEAGEAGAFIVRSSLKSKSTYDPEAISEEDFICTYTDTFTDRGLTGIDGMDNRGHVPLNLSIQQNTYAWSYEYAEDFILFDYQISNIGPFPIRELYVGVYVDADVYHQSFSATGYADDVCGFRRTVPMPDDFCMDEDTVNLAYIVDNDGDPVDGNWSFTSPVAATGIRVVRTPNDSLISNFNWWISNGDAAKDFGPRKQGLDEDPFYPFPLGNLGTPTGDKVKYYILSHPEFDYDQYYTAVSHTDQGYLPPPTATMALDFANGYDTRYLLSFGPFDIPPDSTVPITLAYLAGDNFHTTPTAFADLYDPNNPDVFYNTLNFDDFGTNGRWASWIFDNPGVDTDGDGDSGRYNWSCQVDGDIICFPECETPPEDIFSLCEKIYYRGDFSTSACSEGTGGEPDFVGASPPPPPEVRLIPDYGKMTVRWNGQEAENTIDVFSRQKDFEGYKVYYAEGDRLSDYVFLAGYDLNDFRVFQFNDVLLTWERAGLPLTLDSLQTLYGATFDPAHYDGPYRDFTDPHTGHRLYFTPQDWNVSDLTDQMNIHKMYPDASKEDSTDTTDEGWLRYYEYEYSVDNLQPSKPYNFAVTAFDFGSLKVELGALESSPLVNAVKDYPLPTADIVERDGLGVIVFPNPYRIDGGYAEAGYENRDRTKSAVRSRTIHFANLPRVCTIRIYTLNGDLVREIDHFRPEGGPESQHEIWDVISRNTQAVVTGIYLWHVQSDMGEQVGKLVIMK
ncbi:MAG: hypothetical protein GY841_05965 [FCB group bacterium]|nr:hypothetical protein [FCB group bacterium]